MRRSISIFDPIPLSAKNIYRGIGSVVAVSIVGVMIVAHPAASAGGNASLRIQAVDNPTAIGNSRAAGTARTDSFGIAQVYVPAGCFLMGSNPAVDPQTAYLEQPEHTACLTEGYWIDQFDVTNAAFDAFVQAGGYTNPNYWSDVGLQWRAFNNINGPDTSCLQYSRDPQQPRICVSYYEAEAYANWRGGRLPIEQQWEYAARGTDQRIYPWGNQFDPAKANTSLSVLEQTTVVNRYPGGKSWVNAYDMAGNVWQWVASGYYGTYAQATPSLHTTGLPSSMYQVARGGSWQYEPVRARSANRELFDPTLRRFDTGFRIIVPANPLE